MVMSFQNVSESVDPKTLPDGRYKATWNGYEVAWEIDGRSLHARVDIGVRGWAHGYVTVQGGEFCFDRE